jgi:HSP20 family protein
MNMAKSTKEKKIETEKELKELKREIEQKGKEIEQLKNTIEGIRAKVQEKSETGENELGRMVDNVSELLDVGFDIFGTSKRAQGGKFKGQGLVGVINDLAKLAEKSQTYQKRVNFGKTGEVSFRVSSRPIKGSFVNQPADRIKISKPKSKTLPVTARMPSTTSIKEREPMVDVFEDGDHVNVMTELPGVEENDLNLKLESNLLTINIDTPAGKYCKEVKLPASVEKNSIESKFRNGILEVKLRKTKDSGENDV